MVSGLKSVYNNKILRELYDKIENLNKGSNGNTVRKLEIDLSPWTTSKDFERIFDLISKAIINRTLLSISYTDGNGVTTKRKVEPHKIVLKQNRWYLIGYCLYKEDVRLFKLNRIREIKELDAKFEERDIDFDFSASLRVMDSERKVLKFKNEAYSRAIDYFNEEEIEFCEEQFFYVITYIKDDGWLIATILSFGDMVEVVQPPALRKKIAEKIGSMKEIY